MLKTALTPKSIKPMQGTQGHSHIKIAIQDSLRDWQQEEELPEHLALNVETEVTRGPLKPDPLYFRGPSSLTRGSSDLGAELTLVHR